MIQKKKQKKKAASANRILFASQFQCILENAPSTDRMAFISRLILIFLGTLGLGFCFTSSLETGTNFFIVLLFSILSSVSAALITQKQKAMVLGGLSLLGMSVLIVFFSMSSSLGSIGNTLSSILDSLLRFTVPRIKDNGAFLLILFTILIIASLLFGLFSRLRFGLIGIFAVALVCVAPLYVFSLFPSQSAFTILLIFFIFAFAAKIFPASFYLYGDMKKKQLPRQLDNYRKSRSALAQTAGSYALCIGMVVVLLFTCVIPRDFEMNAPVIRKIESQVRKILVDLVEEKEIGESVINDGLLGQYDKIKYKYQPITTMNMKNDTSIYLRTWVGGDYNTDKWDENINDFQKYLDTYETNRLLEKYFTEEELAERKLLDITAMPKSFFDILEKYGQYQSPEDMGFLYNQLKIKVNGSMPNYLLPSLTWTSPFVLLNENPVAYYRGEGQVQFGQAQLSDYTLDSIIPNYNPEFFEKLEQAITSYQDIAQKVKNNDSSIGSEETKTVVLEQLYSQYVRQRYVQLPDTVTQRTRELAQQLKKDSLYETVTAIQQYFQEHYPYSLSPGRTPVNADFVDYFLFEQQKGFCSHFASAATVMLRSLGYPTRYVEGYFTKFYPDKDEEFSSSTDIPVNDSDAHAWLEVYMEGIGWIPFETTPSYNMNILEWNPVASYEPMNPEIHISLPSMEPEYIESSEMELVEEGQHNMAWFIVLGILGIMILFVASVMVVRLIVLRMRNEKFASDDLPQAVISAFAFMLKLLQLSGCQLGKGERLMDFANRAQQESSLIIPPEFTDAARIFLKARFSDENVVEEEREKMLLCITNMQKRLDESASFGEKLKYKYIKHIL